MSRWRLTKVLVVVAAGLALAAGTVAAVAATRDSDDGPLRTAAQEETDDNERPWLGVFVRPSDEPAGLAVRHVAPGSPAAGAEMEPGDVITAIDGQTVAEFEDLAEAIEAKAVGDSVTLSVVKNGMEEPDAEATDIEVTLAARPEPKELFGEVEEKIGDLFDRFIGGQFSYLDEDGETVTIEMFAGTVSSLSEDEITLEVNGDEGDKSFAIPDDVMVPDDLDVGNRAAVVVRNGEVEHILGGGVPFLPGILPGLPFEGFPKQFEGEGGIFPRFHEGPGFRFDCPCEEPAPQPEEAAPEA